MAPPEVFAATAHFLEFLGLLLAIGSLVVLRLARLEPRIAWAEPPLRNVVAGTLAGGLGLVAAGPPRSALPTFCRPGCGRAASWSWLCCSRRGDVETPRRGC